VAIPVLTRLGYRVVAVDSLDEATRFSKSDLPDLLIVALRLGSFNGLLLLIRMRALESGIPAIILGDASAFSGDVATFGAHFMLKWMSTSRTSMLPTGTGVVESTTDPSQTAAAGFSSIMPRAALHLLRAAFFTELGPLHGYYNGSAQKFFLTSN
jgi:CheY-like chemotaxis protein